MKFFLALLFFSSIIVTTAGQAPFITTWKTDTIVSSCNTCITIPTHPESSYNYEVDWDNDGVFDTTGITGSVTHDFGAPGTHTIAIRGDFPRIFFNNEGDKEKILSVNQWGDIQWESMNSAFYGCGNLNGPMADTPNLSKVTDMAGMFWDAESFNADISDWNVKNVTDMSRLFRGASAFDQDIGSWNVSKVTNFNGIFRFSDSFNQDIGDWDVSNVKSMIVAFNVAKSFNQDVGDWDVSNVTDMRGMFLYASNFNQDIGDWNVTNVTDMSRMFNGASAFNQDIGSWDVSNVIKMRLMFRETEEFNQDIGDWNVSNVYDMLGMFLDATTFNQDIGEWDVSNVTCMSVMLKNSGLSCENYSATLIGWANNPQTPNNIELGAEGMTYGNYAKTARETLISNGWLITGDNKGSCTVSSEQTHRASIALYPNPVKNVLRLDIDQSMTYRILDNYGREVRLGITSGTIDVSQLPSAVYFVHLVDEKVRKTTTEKIIKK